MNCTIRAFAPDDLAALQAIRAEAFAPVFQSFRDLVGPHIAAVALNSADAEQAALLDALAAPGSGQEVWVAESDGRAIGFVALKVEGEVGELGLNAVCNACRNRGVGAALHAHALARMKALGAKVATVGVGGDASHAPARRAYEKAGFGPGIPSLYLYRML